MKKRITIIALIVIPVSYTHLDVYKRQDVNNAMDAVLKARELGLIE